jgi:PEGA domain-containing protein
MMTIPNQTTTHREDMVKVTLLKRAMFLLTFAAAWLVRHPPVHAEAGMLVVHGGAAEHQRAVIGAAVEGAIRNMGWSLSANPLTKNETDDLVDCSSSNTPWSCVPTSLGARGIRGLFVVQVESSQADNGAPLVIITEKMIVTNPPSFTIRQRFCEHCADDRLGAAGEELTQQMVREVAARSGRTVISIASAPVGAEIILDGERVGATDSTFNTFPATHVVIVQKPGFLPASREITIEEGKTAEVYFTLHPSGPPQPPPSPPPPPPPSPPPDLRSQPPRSPPSYLGPGIAIGAGIPLVIFGGYFLYRGQQGGPGDKYIYPRATAAGVASELIGLGAIGTGIYLLWRDSNQAAPSASVTPGGAIVGWAGRF